MTAKRMIPLLLFVLAWQAMSAAGIIPSYKLPSPLQVLRGLHELMTLGMPPGHLLHTHIVHSLQRVLWGYLTALVIAIPLGIAMGWSKALSAAIEPIMEMLRPIPPLAWIPIAILWFGIGNQSAAFIIFLGAFFPILLNTVSGVRTIDPLLIEAARTLNATRRFIFIKVLLPGAFPSIVTGMRIGLGIGWMTLVAAEFTGVRQGYGLGYMIMTARDIQRPEQIVAGMAVIGIIGLTIDAGLNLMERTLLRWR